MANFRTHIVGGAVLGTAVGATAFAFGLVSSRPLLSLGLAGVVAAGSVAPDIDSDTSVPFHVTFGILSLAAGAATLVHVLELFPGDWLRLILWPTVVAVFFWTVVGWVFKKFTRHRGMVHSIPSALLSGLLLFLLAGRLGAAEWSSFLLALSFFLGYLLHLILDELYAAVNFNGLKFEPKRSFGSALKFYSGSRRACLAVYTALAVIILTQQERLAGLVQHLLDFA